MGDIMSAEGISKGELKGFPIVNESKAHASRNAAIVCGVVAVIFGGLGALCLWKGNVGSVLSGQKPGTLCTLGFGGGGVTLIAAVAAGVLVYRSIQLNKKAGEEKKETISFQDLLESDGNFQKMSSDQRQAVVQFEVEQGRFDQVHKRGLWADVPADEMTDAALDFILNQNVEVKGHPQEAKLIGRLIANEKFDKIESEGLWADVPAGEMTHAALDFILNQEGVKIANYKTHTDALIKRIVEKGTDQENQKFMCILLDYCKDNNKTVKNLVGEANIKNYMSFIDQNSKYVTLISCESDVQHIKIISLSTARRLIDLGVARAIPDYAKKMFEAKRENVVDMLDVVKREKNKDIQSLYFGLMDIRFVAKVQELHMEAALSSELPKDEDFVLQNPLKNLWKKDVESLGEWLGRNQERWSQKNIILGFCTPINGSKWDEVKKAFLRECGCDSSNLQAKLVEIEKKLAEIYRGKDRPQIFSDLGKVVLTD